MLGFFDRMIYLKYDEKIEFLTYEQWTDTRREQKKEIPESVHRAALVTAFANGNIGSYDEYLERLKEGYGLQNVKLGHNKAVKVSTFLSNKRMVIKEGKGYAFNPEYHY